MTTENSSVKNHNQPKNGNNSKAKPKRKRKKTRRKPAERGLPLPENLESLARTYLENQHRLWPELIGKELPEKIDEATIARMVNGFQETFLEGEVAGFTRISLIEFLIAAAYLRYSCDQSNPRSLNQQLALSLEKGKQENYFIPWQFVFADAAVSGTTADRTGYKLVKMAMSHEDYEIDAMFIDEIGRASRDMVEALGLGRLLEHHDKFLIGVSDGFDMRVPMWKYMLSMFAAMQEWFVDQLKACLLYTSPSPRDS